MLSGIAASLPPVDWTLLTLAAFAVLVGAVVQGSSGMGLGLLSAPALIIIDPNLGPGPVLVLTVILSSVMIWREFGSIDRPGLAISFSGRVVGSVVAGAIYSLLPLSAYELVFGVLILGAVLLSVFGGRIERTPRNLVFAGFTSGIMGTLTSAGSPTIALVYQKSGGPVIRATLSAFFLLSSMFSLLVLIVIGKFGMKQLTATAAYVPVMLVGFALSNLVVRHVSNDAVRRFVLVLSGASALVLIARAMVSIL